MCFFNFHTFSQVMFWLSIEIGVFNIFKLTENFIFFIRKKKPQLILREHENKSKCDIKFKTHLFKIPLLGALHIEIIIKNSPTHAL